MGGRKGDCKGGGGGGVREGIVLAKCVTLSLGANPRAERT
jgi:hypothetical protein